MKLVCLDAATLGSDVNLDVFGQFGEFVSFETTAATERIERLKGADVVITNKVVIDKAVMEATNLKLICISATGMNNVDLAHAKAKNIAVKNVAGYSTASVVQHTFALLFELTNRIKFYDEYVKNYSTSGANKNSEFKQKSLDELLRSSDIISIHAPLNENTRNLLGINEINLLKDDAIVLNLGRGGIVDETAMARAIDERNLRFGTDVLECEPMSENNPFLKVKNRANLVITPHVAWGSLEARKRLISLVVKNIEEFIKG